MTTIVPELSDVQLGELPSQAEAKVYRALRDGRSAWRRWRVRSTLLGARRRFSQQIYPSRRSGSIFLST